MIGPAQRRCRERHRTHVSELEQEVEDLRAAEALGRVENQRLQTALQQSLIGLEQCQKRWTNTDKVGTPSIAHVPVSMEPLHPTLSHSVSPYHPNNLCMVPFYLTLRTHQPDKVAPGRRCSKHHRVAFNSRSEGLKCEQYVPGPQIRSATF